MFKERNINIEKFDNGVWISFYFDGGGCHSILSREQAEELIKAIKLSLGE
jgi:coproporphyrinogen III oxidase-like Fe-S oxidoreductase